MSIEKQKVVADYVLGKFESIDPTCIIAGGAPRDWYFGKEASDIDLFFYFRPDLQMSHIMDALERVGMMEYFLQEKSGESIPEHYKRNPYLSRVFEFHVEGVKVQAMQMLEPTFKSCVGLFPLSICKAWYKNGKISTSKDFDLSMKINSIYITNKLYNDADSYLQKIKGKFPDYKWFNSKAEALVSFVEGMT